MANKDCSTAKVKVYKIAFQKQKYDEGKVCGIRRPLPEYDERFHAFTHFQILSYFLVNIQFMASLSYVQYILSLFISQSAF